MSNMNCKLTGVILSSLKFSTTVCCDSNLKKLFADSNAFCESGNTLNTLLAISPIMSTDKIALNIYK